MTLLEVWLLVLFVFWRSPCRQKFSLFQDFELWTKAIKTKVLFFCDVVLFYFMCSVAFELFLALPVTCLVCVDFVPVQRFRKKMLMDDVLIFSPNFRFGGRKQKKVHVHLVQPLRQFSGKRRRRIKKRGILLGVIDILCEWVKVSKFHKWHTSRRHLKKTGQPKNGCQVLSKVKKCQCYNCSWRRSGGKLNRRWSFENSSTS